jgi:hypothetical protein
MSAEDQFMYVVDQTKSIPAKKEEHDTYAKRVRRRGTSLQPFEETLPLPVSATATALRARSPTTWAGVLLHGPRQLPEEAVHRLREVALV